MADVVYLLIIVAFFGISVAYVRGCERIIRGAEDSDTPIGGTR